VDGNSQSQGDRILYSTTPSSKTERETRGMSRFRIYDIVDPLPQLSR
jgi:hypothetical protein